MAATDKAASSPIQSQSSRRGSSSLPSGFRLSGASIAKETHGQPIYCAAWSVDLHAGGLDRSAEGTTEIGDGGVESSNKDSASAAEAAIAPLASASSSPRPDADVDGQGKPPAGGEAALLRCLATCGGNHVTVYEVGVGHGSGGGLNLRQAYRDADPDELFYTCAFGGRGLGSHVGLGPTADLVADGKGSETVVLRAEAPAMSDGEGRDEDDANSSHGEAAGERETARRKEKRRKLFQTLADLSKYDGPQLLCAAGRRGVVKVIDTVRRSLLLTLSGHGDEIYDMKFSPVDEWLLLTASKDESLRLWNVKNATCVAIFAGHEGHRDAVLSCSWHPLGRQFASSGMDTTVKLWSLEAKVIKDAIKESFAVRPRRKKGLAAMEPAGEGSTPPRVFRTVYEQTPFFSTSKVHTDYVDCVQFVGDLILSKSINDIIVLWKPDLSNPSSRLDGSNDNSGSGSNSNHRAGTHHNKGNRTRNEAIALREFVLNKCDIWFVRFQTDPNCRMLATGNNIGEVKVWDVMSFNPTKRHFANLTHQHCASTVRMVSFSPDGKMLLATCDDSSVWKWDAY